MGPQEEGREWIQVPESLPTLLGGPGVKRARETPIPFGSPQKRSFFRFLMEEKLAYE